MSTTNEDANRATSPIMSSSMRGSMPSRGTGAGNTDLASAQGMPEPKDVWKSRLYPEPQGKPDKRVLTEQEKHEGWLENMRNEERTMKE